MLLRTGIVLAGFYFIARGQWERLVACLCGFVISRMMARVIVTRLTRAGRGGESCVLLPIS
jgi:F1F0 ATPase subunit 2